MDNFTIVSLLVEKLGLPESWAGRYLHISMSVIALLLITIISLLARRRLKHTRSHIVPEGRATIANIMELIVSALVRMMEDIIGPGAEKHLPLIGSIFIYILVCNLMGVVPGLSPPTDNINTNFACAIVVFIYYNYAGIREHGFRCYLKHMAGPIVWLAPLIFTIEVVSHLVRPISLSVRLFGNITGDHVVLGIFSQLTPLVVPVIFMMLTIFVAFIQAFVFTLLSIVYIALASGKDAH